MFRLIRNAAALLAVAAVCEGAAAGAPRLRSVQREAFRPVALEAGRPRFHIPPDSALARNEHPRFLLTTADLARLKERASDPRLQTHVESMAKRSFSKYPSNLERAVLYRLTGEKRYLAAIVGSKGFERPTWVFTWAATIDLIWDDVSPERRRQLSDAVAEAVAKGGELYWRPTLHLVSVFYEGGKGPNDAVFLARMKKDFDETVVRWTDKLNRWAAGRGGWDMSHGYHGEHAYWEPFCAAICWSHASGEDYIGRAELA